ncbi:MAG TPA: tail fiber domain-containing protein [Planctomycetota bacterium]|jgi:hypothetical protein
MYKLVCVVLTILVSNAWAATKWVEFDAPRGGEVYFAGQVQQVKLSNRWRVSSIRIELSRDGGKTYKLLGTMSNVTADRSARNTMPWTIAGPASSNCLLRAVGNAGSTETTILSGVFAIGLDGTMATGTLPDAAVGAPALAPSSVTNIALADNSVTAAELADGSVTTPKIANGAVTQAKIADKAVSAEKVGSGAASNNFVLTADGAGGAEWLAVEQSASVANFTGNLAGDITGTQTATLIAAGVVTTAKLADGAVSDAKIASVSGAKVTGTVPNALNASNFSGSLAGDVTGTQTATVIANNAVTDAKIAGVSGAKVAGTVANAAMAANFSGALAGDVTGPQNATTIADNAVTDAKITSVSGAKVAGAVANAITAIDFSGFLTGDVTGQQNATAIADNAVTTAKIADGAVTDAKIADVSGAKVTGAVANATTAVDFSGFLAGDVTGPQSATTIADNAVTTAKIADGAITDAKIADVSGSKVAGAVANATTAVSFSGFLTGDVTGQQNATAIADNAVTTGKIADGNITAAKLAPNTAWLTGGNAGTTPGTNYIGTSDATALEIKVGGYRAQRIEPAAIPDTDAPNIIGGFSGNSVTAGIKGATISGGGASGSLNQVTADYGAVGGGLRNNSTGWYSTIAGGDSNTAGFWSAVGGGKSSAASGQYATVSGGLSNTSSGMCSAVGGGLSNTASGMDCSAVSGGLRNTASGGYSVVCGGNSNTASGWVSTVGGGMANIASGLYSTAVGGARNTAAGDYSFVAGYRAKDAIAAHGGVFLFADGNDLDFNSVAANEFAVRATGGVRFVTKVNTATGAPMKTLGISGSGITLDFTLDSVRVLSLIPAVVPATDAPSLIGGYSGNSVAAGKRGAIVAGGGMSTYLNSVTGHYGTIGGGRGNTVSGDDCTVGGGWTNTTTASYATVAGGWSNTAGYASAVGGGQQNVASGNAAVVSGGSSNVASAQCSSVGGGYLNTAAGAYSFAAGRRAKNLNAAHVGVFLFADSTDADFTSTAANEFAVRATGGFRLLSDTGGGGLRITPPALPTVYAPNVVAGMRDNGFAVGVFGATIAGGGMTSLPNTVTANYATVSGGINNIGGGEYACVGGGSGNSATSGNAVVAGGSSNMASGLAASVGGGSACTASGSLSTVAGGQVNRATAELASIGGGLGNTASGNWSTISGGSANLAQGWASYVGGGYSNSATGDYSTVIGGSVNAAAGNWSLAAGHRAKVSSPHIGAMLFADAFDVDFNSSAANEFAVRATGGVRFVTNLGGAGAKLDAGATSWSVISDRNAKKNFAPVSGSEVLTKIAALDVSRWNYTWETDTSVPHIGPVAQDFKSAFYPGRDDKSISTLEFDGVELAAIKALESRTAALSAENEQLKKKNAALEQSFAGLESRLRALESK